MHKQATTTTTQITRTVQTNTLVSYSQDCYCFSDSASYFIMGRDVMYDAYCKLT